MQATCNQCRRPATRTPPNRLLGVRLVCLGDAELGLWRLAASYPAAQTEVLAVLPKLAAPLLSLGKPNRRRLKKRRQPRASH